MQSYEFQEQQLEKMAKLRYQKPQNKICKATRHAEAVQSSLLGS